MLGESFFNFKTKYESKFYLINNVLYYKNNYFCYINLDCNLEIYDLYDLFFRFKNQLDAFNYYRIIYDSQDDYYIITLLCDIYEKIYNLIQYEKNIIILKDKLGLIDEYIDKNINKLPLFLALNYNKGWNKTINRIIYENNYLQSNRNSILKQIEQINIY